MRESWLGRGSKGRVGAGFALAALGLVLAASAGCNPFKSKEKKAFGEECAQDTDCESLECATYGSVCSKSCTYDKECGAGFVCRVRDDRPGQVCSKPQGQPPNGTCNTAAECQHAHCLHKVGEQDKPGFCSMFCETPDDCPAGLKICDSISDSGALKLCLPGDEKTPAAARPAFVAPKPVAKPATTVAQPGLTGITAPSAAPTAATTAAATATPSAEPTAAATAAPSAEPTATSTGRPGVPIRPRTKK